MKNKLLHRIGIGLLFTLILLNVNIVSTNLITSVDLHNLKVQACEIFPESYGYVAFMQWGPCGLVNNTVIYGCSDANATCNPW